eukprot:TRINITY_DN4782_c0_g1_i5.p1 TRINITY_DN4782_c0_g1~~TRINITY_DN4782_c0_g1_i5.p1  ORF type:complete len:221 (-),score=86.33 TRINITY_DN4782_c0_g1_i5:3-665(-)
MRDFKAGEQVFMNYGNRTSAEFLLNAGFMPASNPNDYVRLKLVLRQDDPAYRTKCNGIGTDSVTFVLDEGKYPRMLLTFARMMAMDEADLKPYLGVMLGLCPGSEVVSEGNETMARNLITNKIRKLLSIYPASAPAPSPAVSPYMAACFQRLQSIEKAFLTKALERMTALIEGRMSVDDIFEAKEEPQTMPTPVEKIQEGEAEKAQTEQPQEEKKEGGAA